MIQLINLQKAPPDSRDYQFVCGTAGLPAATDLRNFASAVKWI